MLSTTESKTHQNPRDHLSWPFEVTARLELGRGQ
jgi:hypothetical protein